MPNATGVWTLALTLVFNCMLVTLRIEAGDHNFSNLGDTLVYC